MLTIRLESTLGKDYVDYYNKLFVFDSNTGSLKAYETNPFKLENKNLDEVLKEFNVTFDKSIPYKYVINETIDRSYSFPFKLFVDITDKCQLNCEHCLTKKLNLNNELSIETLRDVIAECNEHGLFFVKIGGGEPFMHPNIYEIIEKFHQAGMYVSLSTNGILIDDTAAKVLRDNKVKVSISIEGPRNINDIIRGQGHFDIAMNALDILKKNGCNVILRVTLTRYMLNEDYLYELINLAKEKNVKLKVSYCRPAGNAIDNHLLIQYEDYEKYNSIINILNDPAYEEIIIMDEGMQIKQDPGLRELLYNGRICGAANRSMHINSEGKIAPCVFLGQNYIETNSNYQYGDILRYWSEEEGSKFNDVRIIPTPKTCENCNRLCSYECLATRLYFNNNPEINDPNCLKEVKIKCLKAK